MSAPPVIIIRPEPGAQESLLRFHAAGLAARKYSLFSVQPVDDPALSQGIGVKQSAYDALMITSANAVRYAPLTQHLRSLPCYAVGKQTAQIARDAGLNVIMTGAGGISSLLAPAVQNGHLKLLRLAGMDNIVIDDDLLARHNAGDLRIDTRIVYQSQALPMPPDFQDILQNPAIILLHSARSAGHFAEQCDVHEIDRSIHRLASFGPLISAAAGFGWAGVFTADAPNDEALLALTRQLCKD